MTTTHLLVIFMLSALLPGLGFGLTFREKVLMNKGEVTITIQAEEEHRDFALYVRERVRTYLPAVEKFLGQDFPRTDFQIRIQDTIGYNHGDRIEISPTLPHSPALLFHELNHYWFGYQNTINDPAWLIEGLMSFIPLAMYEQGVLDLNPAEWQEIRRSWDLRYWDTIPPEIQDPLVDAQGQDMKKGWTYFYPNTFKVQFLIHKELGIEKYHAFLLTLIRNWPLKNSREVLSILNRLKKQNWEKRLGGWLFPSPKPEIPALQFRDSDLDGLLDVEEIYGLTDPLNPDTDGDGYADGWKNGHHSPAFFPPQSHKLPVMDGVPDPSYQDPWKTVRDEKGDGDSTSDIEAMSLYRIENKLYVQVSFFKKELRTTYLTFHLEGSDGRNYWLQLWTTRPDLRWASQFKQGEPFEKWQNMKTVPPFELGYSQIVELLIDPALLDLNTFHLTFIAGGIKADEKIFHSDSVRISDINW